MPPTKGSTRKPHTQLSPRGVRNRRKVGKELGKRYEKHVNTPPPSKKKRSNADREEMDLSSSFSEADAPIVEALAHLESQCVNANLSNSNGNQNHEADEDDEYISDNGEEVEEEKEQDDHSDKNNNNKVHCCEKCHRIFKETEKYCVSCIKNGKKIWKFKGGEEDQKKQIAKSFFAVFDIETALKNILEEKDAREKLRYRYTREKPVDESFSDIYDGMAWQRLEMYGYLGDGMIGFIWNTDGFQPWKRSKKTAWPIFLAIGDLDPKDRYRACNVIIPCFYIGPKKPVMHEFLKPLVKQMKRLWDEGVTISPPGEEEWICRAVLAVGIFDHPARLDVLGMCGQAALIGTCFICEISGQTWSPVASKRGKSVKVDKRKKNRSKTIYPWTARACTLRKGPSYWKDEAKKIADGNSFLKHDSPLFQLKYFDPRYGIGFDPMHTLWEGVVRYFLKVWVGEGRDGKLYNFRRQKLDLFEEFLGSVRLPSNITQQTRKWNNGSYWRGI